MRALNYVHVLKLFGFAEKLTKIKKSYLDHPNNLALKKLHDKIFINEF